MSVILVWNLPATCYACDQPADVSCDVQVGVSSTCQHLCCPRHSAAVAGWHRCATHHERMNGDTPLRQPPLPEIAR